MKKPTVDPKKRQIWLKRQAEIKTKALQLGIRADAATHRPEPKV
jgi:hypothetical protein